MPYKPTKRQSQSSRSHLSLRGELGGRFERDLLEGSTELGKGEVGEARREFCGDEWG